MTWEQLVIDPRIEGDESRYDYLWYAFPAMIARAPIDTLSHERRLDYTVQLGADLYTLVFQVTDRQYGTSVYQSTSLSVSSLFGVGYYVHKTENGVTDADFIDRYGQVNENVFAQVNGESLPGQFVGASYFSIGYSYQQEEEDGEIIQYAGEPAYVVLSDQDVRIFHGVTLTELANFETLFMETPAVKKPENIAASTIGFILINDNTACQMSTGNYNIGKFGYPYPNRDYLYSKYLINGLQGFITFDEATGRFMGYNSGTKEAFTDATYSEYDLIYLAAQPLQQYFSYYSFALLRHKTEQKAYFVKIYSLYIGSSLFSFLSEVPVPLDMEVLNAGVWAVGGANEVLYYSTGDNRVSYYNSGNQNIRQIVTLPDNEKVVYLKNVYDAYFGPNLLLVLSDAGGNWKLRVYDFEGTTSDPDLTTERVYSGSGLPCSVIYRDANTEITY
ncbi:MAG: hypothetical protein LUD68_05340 [Rikenellaceae bacterium]|nr:hypothetical protein [Rikenellaceae bacterium]